MLKNSEVDWKPSASLHTLKARAEFIKTIRDFFYKNKVMEVETPLLYRGVATDPRLQAFLVNDRFLQTSPEFLMKRLLAQGCEAIYYLGKAFRKGEQGSRHNPEFTILEWYRPGWDHFQLIAEMDLLLQTLLDCPPALLTTYRALFEKYFNLHPHIASVEDCIDIALQKNWIDIKDIPDLDLDGWLDFLLTQGIEPHLGLDAPLVVLDYPASQAALAKIKTVTDNPPYKVGERFEFYYKGLELANGYHELICSKEQQMRFEEDVKKRISMNLPEVPIDYALLAAMESGMPTCAGVAVGVDRLLMLKLQESNIAKVVSFAWENA